MSASLVVKENKEHEDQKNTSESNQVQIKSIQSTTESTTENKPTQIQSTNSSPVIQSQQNQPLSTPSIQSATTPKSNTMAQSHEELPKFDPGRYQSAVGTKWSKWLEVWDLYLASRKMDKVDTTT